MLIGALEAGGTKMVCSIGNPEGGVLQRASFPTVTPDVTIPQIVDFIGKFDVKALGIGSFGPLDLNPASPTYGSITKTPKTDWIDYPAAEYASGGARRADGHRHGRERRCTGGAYDGRGQGTFQPAVCDGRHGHRRRSGDRRQ